MIELLAMLFVLFSLVSMIFGLCGLNIVDQWSRRPVLRLGKYHRTLGPGITWVNPILCRRLEDVSIRENVERLTLQNVQTHDNVRVNLQLTLTSIVKEANVETVTLVVENALGRAEATDEDDDGNEKTVRQQGALQRKVIAATMEALGRASLDRVLSSRTEVCNEVQTALGASIKHWGIDILALEITDFAIADERIEQAIAMKARAEKEAQAELKRAEMQKQIALELKKAAAEFDEPAWRLKTLETLVELCRSAQNNTIILPASLGDFANALSGVVKA